MEDQTELNILCEVCQKSYLKTTILKHTCKSNLCKLYYGSRFSEMKETNAREKKQKQKQANFKKKELKLQKEIYAQNPQNSPNVKNLTKPEEFLSKDESINRITMILMVISTLQIIVATSFTVICIKLGYSSSVRKEWKISNTGRKENSTVMRLSSN